MKEERGYFNQPRENLPAKSPLLQTSRDNLNHRYPKPRGAPLHSRVNSIFELQDAKNPSNPATSLNQTLQLNEPLLRDLCEEAPLGTAPRVRGFDRA